MTTTTRERKGRGVGLSPGDSPDSAPRGLAWTADCEPSKGNDTMRECICGVSSCFIQRESTARKVWFSPPAMCVEDATGPVGNTIEWPSVVLLLSRNGQNRSDAGAKVLLCVSPLRS